MPAKTQHLPKSHLPADCELRPCPECASTATRFVFQHLCDTKKEVGHLAKVTWEVPAYTHKSDSKPYKWRCPVCNGQEHEVALLKCGNCGRIVRV